VVDGKTLVYILDKRANLQEDFLKLTSHCSSVLGCRATPLQKAYIVRIVKEELKMHTMAIGDGANDVSMIQVSRIKIFFILRPRSTYIDTNISFVNRDVLKMCF
jgi:phospholipid-translocating ATPase